MHDVAVFWLITIHGIVHWLGCDYGANYGQFQPYDFLSGVAGLSLLGIFLNTFRKHNCQKKWCLRIGHHEFTDPKGNITRHLCWKHHPDVVHKRLSSEVIDIIHQRRKLAKERGTNHGTGTAS